MESSKIKSSEQERTQDEVSAASGAGASAGVGAATATATAAAASALAQEQTQTHGHDHVHADDRDLINSSSTYKRLVLLAGFASVATAIVLILMKFVVWLMSGSTTILASLTDSLIDLGASFINLLALRFALTPADKDHRFGHYKAEALASLSQAAFICGSAMILIVHGYDRLVNPQPISYVDIAIYVSIASIVITLVLTFFQGYICKVTHSEAIEADRFHYLSDVGLNLSVIVALILAKFGYEWADGLITIFLGLYIMKSSWHIGMTAVRTLLDHSMSPEDNTKIIRAIVSVKGIESFHDLRTRQAGPQHYIQCHIVLDHTMPLEQAHNLASEAENNIRKDFPDADIMLHMEPDLDDTFKDITFIDQQYCVLPDYHYKYCVVPESHYENAKARANAEANAEANTKANAEASVRTDADTQDSKQAAPTAPAASVATEAAVTTKSTEASKSVTPSAAAL